MQVDMAGMNTYHNLTSMLIMALQLIVFMVCKQAVQLAHSMMNTLVSQLRYS